MSVGAGLFAGDPAKPEGPYGEEWYTQGRYSVSLGRFWTEHLKTEIEFATTGEGTRYTQRYATVPGVPPYYPISVQEHFKLTQLSGRGVWQFFENSWVHPYLFGGVSLDAERQRAWVPEQFFYGSGDPRNPATRIPLTTSVSTGPDTTYRVGALGGFGSKFYMSPRAYFNTSVVMSQAKTSRNVSLIAGFGWDF